MSKWFILVCASCLAISTGGFVAIMVGDPDLILPGVVSLLVGVTLFVVYVLAHWVYHEGIQSVLIHVRFHLLIGSLVGAVFPALHGGGRILIGMFAGLLVGAFLGYLQRPKPDPCHSSEHDKQIATDD